MGINSSINESVIEMQASSKFSEREGVEHDFKGLS